MKEAETRADRILPYSPPPAVERLARNCHMRLPLKATVSPREGRRFG